MKFMCEDYTEAIMWPIHFTTWGNICMQSKEQWTLKGCVINKHVYIIIMVLAHNDVLT